MRRVVREHPQLVAEVAALVREPRPDDRHRARARRWSTSSAGTGERLGLELVGGEARRRVPVLVRGDHLRGARQHVPTALRGCRAGDPARQSWRRPTPTEDDAQRELVEDRRPGAGGGHPARTSRDYFRLSTAETASRGRRPGRGGGPAGGRGARLARRRTRPATLRVPRRVAGVGAAGALRPADLVPRRAPSGCSGCATASRSTPRPTSACTATTCCRSCTAGCWSARVDLKADRAASALRVQAAHAEPAVTEDAVADLAGQLREMAGWLGLADVAVAGVGDLAGALDRALQSPS